MISLEGDETNQKEKCMKRSQLFGYFFFLLGSLTCGLPGFSQILFSEDCFVGGVTVAGANTVGAGFNIKSKINWSPEKTIRKATAITYRYGRPIEFNMFVNSTPVNWNSQNIVGDELIDDDPGTLFYATHAEDISESLIISEDTLIIDLPTQQPPSGGNIGWFGIYIVIQYESPNISTQICNRIYIADQRQDFGQTYSLLKPNFIEETPVALSLFTSRITASESDASRVLFNNIDVGKVWEYDLNVPPTIGVQGHFYYEDSIFEGLNGDTANTKVWRHDGIMRINEYFVNGANQELRIFRIAGGVGNLHPAFCITYTPTCPVSNAEMQREYSFCKLPSAQLGEPDITDTIQLNAIPGYDNYEWKPASGLSNATIANPLCYADSSGWYRVRMWNDDEGGACAQTTPVFITVGNVPRPRNLQVRASFCPQNTGRIVFAEMEGKAPFQYRVNGNTKTSGTFENLAPGTYDVSVTDALGCNWDSTAVVALDPIQTAAFTANPDSGYSPLRVVLTNQSTDATDYIWLVNGLPFSNSTNTSYTFADTGTYVIALIAIRNETSCADTAYATIRVEQGLKVIVPNIITPNGDGRNDALIAQTAGVAYMRWEIRNRWGNLLHMGEATSPPPALTLWSPGDGEYPDGVYTIVFTVKGESGEMREFAAQVSLING